MLRMAHNQHMDERIDRLMAAIRAEAAARRITVKALAAEAEVSYPAMRRYLNGERSMDLSQLYRVADALGIDVDDLLTEAARTDAIAEGRVIHAPFGRGHVSDDDLDYDHDLEAVAHESDGEPTDEQ